MLVRIGKFAYYHNEIETQNFACIDHKKIQKNTKKIHKNTKIQKYKKNTKIRKEIHKNTKYKNKYKPKTKKNTKE